MSSETEKFLNNQLNALHYSPDFHSVIRQQVLEVVKDFRGLKLKDKNYVYPDGRSADLLLLEGTIPMFFKMTKYNIPMAIWIPECFPLELPILYVVPTSNMIIKPGHGCVDPNGLVTAGCATLRNWSYPESSLRNVLGELQNIFGQDPPLFTKTANLNNTTTTVSPSPSSATSTGGGQPQPQQSNSPFAAIFGAVVGGAAAAAAGRPQSGSSSAHQQTNDHHIGVNPLVGGAATAAGSGSIWGGALMAQQAQQAQQQKVNHEKAQQDVDHAFRVAAINALNQRISSSLASSAVAKDAEANKQLEIKAELQRREVALQTELANLQAERDALDGAAHQLTTAGAALQKWLADNEPRVASAGSAGDVDADTAIVPADELSKQALIAQAADVALEDAMRALDGALENGKLQLDSYLRHIRNLSRRQFTARALSQKVCIKQQQEEAARKKKLGASSSSKVQPGAAGSSGQQQQQQQADGAQLPIGDLWHNTGGILLTNPLTNAPSRRVML